MLNVTSNYLRIEEKPNTGVYEYEVRFIPNVDMRNERFRLIRQIEPIIGDVRVSTKHDDVWVEKIWTNVSLLRFDQVFSTQTLASVIYENSVLIFSSR